MRRWSRIVRTAIDPFEKGARFSVEVPDIDVGPSAVFRRAMILNELCTNAVKYGALSNAHGHVAISAAIDASNERFGFRWVETGGPSVRQPSRQSFGTRLIEQGFVGELRGKAHLSLCTLRGRLQSRYPFGVAFAGKAKSGIVSNKKNYS